MITPYNKNEARRDFKNNLYEPQKQLLYRIKQSFSEKKPAVVCAGMRAGKTVMYSALALDYNHVMVVGTFGGFAQTMNHLRHATDMMRELHHNVVDLVHAPVFFDMPIRRVTENTLIIMEDAFWWKYLPRTHRSMRDLRCPEVTTSEAFFNEVTKATPHVLAIGSYGPMMFQEHEVWNYATWDLNIAITRRDLEPNFVDDPEKAHRDFEGLPP